MKKLIFVFFLCIFVCYLPAEEQETDFQVATERSSEKDTDPDELNSGIEEVVEMQETSTETDDAILPADPENQIYEFPWAGEINGNRVNVRSGGNQNFEILCQADKGDLVIVLDEEVGWYKIEPPADTYFWVHKDYMDDGVITAYSVNIRSGPGTRYSINSQGERGEKVEVADEVDDWYKIKAPPRSSIWVHSDYVEYKMPYEEYKEKLDTEIAAQIAEKERKRLLQEAEHFERKEFYKPIDEINFVEIIKKYDEIVNNYPGTNVAKIAQKQAGLVRKKYADSMEYLHIAEKSQEKKKKEYTPERGEVEVKKGEKVIVEGTLEDFGVVIHRPGTYKLVNGRTRICVLKAGNIDLNPFLYHKVRIKGTRIESDFEIPAVEVEEIELIN